MNCNCEGEKLISLGTLIAFKLAQCLSADDLAIVGSLLVVIGDQLALLSTTKANCLAASPLPAKANLPDTTTNQTKPSSSEPPISEPPPEE